MFGFLIIHKEKHYYPDFFIQNFDFILYTEDKNNDAKKYDLEINSWVEINEKQNYYFKENMY